MNKRASGRASRRSASGQTLVAAMIILGVLMIVGFVFLAVVSRNIFQSGVSRQRTQSYDLAEAGIRWVHSQLLNSPEGADFRPIPSLPVSNQDPDFDFLRPDPDNDPTNGDQGGPDGMGAYTRVNYGNGRFIVRLRYGPSDAELFSTAQNGPLRQPGRARNYLILESIGKVGRVNAQDPTTLLGKDSRESSKLIAFASIPVIESAMYISGSDRTSNVAEIGTLRPFGLMFQGADVDVPVIFGSQAQVYNYGNPPTPAPGTVGLGGSIYSNLDLMVHGRVITELNQPLGDGFLVAGAVRGADAAASLTINRSYWQAGPGWQADSMTFVNGGSPSLDSRAAAFATFNGLFRDGMDGTDPNGYWRNVGQKAAPSIVRSDPETGLTRYYQISRNSGWISNFGNVGRWGHGNNPYIDNTQDLQMRTDEEGRATAGSSESLVYDWFHPNNGQANSGWMGPYYIPRGALLLLDSDGFTIIRDSRATGSERTWRTTTGADSGSSVIRYQVGSVNGVPYIINSFTPGANMGSMNPNFAAGRPFGGVLYFEGNVRVRGVIPTDVQMTVVSNATVYVEGSITKGVYQNFVTNANGPGANARINRPSGSMLMLMAKDYVALNPTMFFGPGVGQSLEEASEEANSVAWNPIRMRTGGVFTFRTDIGWNPNSGSQANPSSWETYLEGYLDAGSPGTHVPTKLVVSHATDDGAASHTFMSMYVNYGLANPDYFFAMVAPNSAAPYFAPQPYGAMYGLGSESWQRYPKFESTAFTLLDPDALVRMNNGTSLRAGSPGSYGDYTMLVDSFNDLTFRHNQIGGVPTNDYMIARAAILPFDVRIEAAMFAEQGSFVVIPGNWFNPNPNDRRGTPGDPATAGTFEGNITKYMAAPYSLTHPQAVARAMQERLENFGAGPDMPFYQEPLDVRISIFGAISQNMPLPMSYQNEWMQKWGWIPKQTGYQFDFSRDASILIPTTHNHPLFDLTAGAQYVPNLITTFDPALATASPTGFGGNYLRRDSFGRPLPPMPALPVSPTLSYFGEVLR